MEIWTRYLVTWQFKNKLCGSVPQSPDLIKPWLAARAPKVVPAAVAAGDAPTLDDLEAEVLESLPDQGDTETVDRITLGFQANQTGLYLRSGTIKAHLKDCARQLMKPLDFKNLRSHVADAVYLEDDEIPILRTLVNKQAIVTAHDGDFEVAVHVMTPRGPRNSLKRIRYIDQPAIQFTMRVLLKRLTDQTHRKEDEVLETIFDYGSVHGYGGERGMGMGRYAWTLTPVVK
ncbi:MAG: hypothetical protein C5B60_05530 [Chloroflexi bacterium]|nr:MAG: hypothetical protein C5B60_05530 [Chloroflexota bacterium]